MLVLPARKPLGCHTQRRRYDFVPSISSSAIPLSSSLKPSCLLTCSAKRRGLLLPRRPSSRTPDAKNSNKFLRRPLQKGLSSERRKSGRHELERLSAVLPRACSVHDFWNARARVQLRTSSLCCLSSPKIPKGHSCRPAQPLPWQGGTFPPQRLIGYGRSCGTSLFSKGSLKNLGLLPAYDVSGDRRGSRRH